MSDIAINPVTRRVQFTGNTGTGPYAFTFNVLQSSDIVVYKNNVLLTETTDYTVSIAANGTGNITMVVALVLTDILTIIGGRELSRTTDFVTAGDLLASSLNEQLDSNVIMSQQLDERFGRTLAVPPGDEDKTLDLPLAADRADKIILFDESGNVTAAAPSDFFGNAVLGGNFIVNTATGNGSQTAFGLTVAPGIKTNIQIHIDGVYQNKSTFSLSGSTVTFTEAPPLNAGIEFMMGESVTQITGDASAITYNQGGTGAQDRTVRGKLQETVSVKDFGAVGDGVADDTAAFKAAILACETANLVLRVPAGDYLITDTLDLHSGMSIVGEGEYSQASAYTSDVSSPVTINFAPTSAKDLFHAQRTAAEVSAGTTHGSKVAVQNMRIVGNTTGGVTNSRYGINSDRMITCSFRNLSIEKFQTGIYVNYSIQCDYTNIFISACSTTCVSYSSTVSTTDTWLRCYFTNTPTLALFDTVTNIKFFGCIFESAGAHGLDIYRNSSGIELVGCYSEDAPTGSAPTTSFIKVGVNGTGTASEAPQIKITGGSFGGPNSATLGYGGTFLEADYVYAVLVSGVHITRFTTGFSATANTANNGIQIYGLINTTLNTFSSGSSGKIIGIYAPTTDNVNPYFKVPDARFTSPQFIQEAGPQGAKLICDVGTPEGVYTAPVGSLYLRSNGGAGTTLYIKESGTGNTGWVAK